MTHLEEQLVKATKRVNARLMDGTEIMLLGDLGYLIFSYRSSVDAVKVDGDDLAARRGWPAGRARTYYT